MKGKAKRRRVHRNIPKRVWDFGMVLEAGIYPRTAGKDGNPALEQLTGGAIDIPEWLNLSSMTLCGFGITSQITPSQCWDDG